MLTYRQGDHARRGGLDLTISLTPDQAAALGPDAAKMAEELDTVLVGLAALRTGQDPAVPASAEPSLKDRPVSAGLAWDEWLVGDAHRLRNRLTGVRAAAIRAYDDHASTAPAGIGSHRRLAAAMGSSSPQTGQSCRRRIAGSPPSTAEWWATTPATDGGDAATGRNVTPANTRADDAEVGHQGAPDA